MSVPYCGDKQILLKQMQSDSIVKPNYYAKKKGINFSIPSRTSICVISINTDSIPSVKKPKWYQFSFKKKQTN